MRASHTTARAEMSLQARTILRLISAAACRAAASAVTRSDAQSEVPLFHHERCSCIAACDIGSASACPSVRVP